MTFFFGNTQKIELGMIIELWKGVQIDTVYSTKEDHQGFGLVETGKGTVRLTRLTPYLIRCGPCCWYGGVGTTLQFPNVAFVIPGQAAAGCHADKITGDWVGQW